MKRLTASFRRDYLTIDEWAKQHPPVLVLQFERILANPKRVAEILQDFVERDLDLESMAKVVANRSAECYDGLLELDLIEAYGKQKAKS